jgi:Plasmid encoded RepA protein
MSRKPPAPVEIHCPSCDYRGVIKRVARRKLILCPNCIRPIKDGRRGNLLKAADFLYKIPAVKHNIADLKEGGPVSLRLIQTQTHIRTSEELAMVWSHAVFCQIGLPYRDPGDEVREWERRNGNLFLKVNAGEALNPDTEQWVKLGLPWGPKVRLVQIYLDTQAVKTQSPIIETDSSLTRFITEKLKLHSKGGNIRLVKDALARLAASTFRIGKLIEKGAKTVPALPIVEDFDVWFQKDERQRVLFPSFVQYTQRYYDDLVEHAVPLLEDAVAALSHNAMALDIYRWLTHRLTRIKPNCPILLFWNVVHEQFGGPARLDNFRREFLQALNEVLAVYPQAQGSVYVDADRSSTRCKDGRGLWLCHAAPPVRRQQGQALLG